MDQDVKTWVLNPDYRFKNDIDRICMYSLNKNMINNDSSPDWISYVHPFQAIILSCFDGVNTLSEICENISDHFNISNDTVEQLINQFINNEQPVYTCWGGENIKFPKNILLPKDRVQGKIPYRDISNLLIQCSKVTMTPDRMHRAPHSILWMLTSKCVTDCAYCYADKSTGYKSLSTQRCLEIIDEAYRLGVIKIDIIGGEVFLRNDWDILIEKMVNLGMSPSFISTKMPVSFSILERLKKTGYSNVIQISLDSLNENVLSDTIKARNGYIKKLIDGIHILDDFGFKIQIDTILTKKTATKDNLNTLASFISTIKNLVYWEIRVPQYTLYSKQRFNEERCSLSQIKDICHHVDNSLKKSLKGDIIFSDDAASDKLRCTGPESPYFKGGVCGFLKEMMFILPDGKVSACEQLYWHPEFQVGDLATQSIEQVWQSDKAKSLFNPSSAQFRKESECSRCGFFEKCMTNKRRCVMKVMKAYGTENWDYPDPRCVFAPVPAYEIDYR